MSEKHVTLLKQMMVGNKWSYGTVFRRVRNSRSMAELRHDAIAGCLRTPRGGALAKFSFKQVLEKLKFVF